MNYQFLFTTNTLAALPERIAAGSVFRIGNFPSHSSRFRAADLYLFAQVGNGEFTLISLINGNRWNESVSIPHVRLDAMHVIPRFYGIFVTREDFLRAFGCVLHTAVPEQAAAEIGVSLKLVHDAATGYFFDPLTKNAKDAKESEQS